MDPADFEALLHGLDPDRDAAGARYEILRLKLCRYFAYRGQPGAEELADETLDRVGRRLARGEELRADPSAFALGVARNVLREAWDRQRRRDRAGEEVATAMAAPDHAPGEGEPWQGAPLAALASCLARLPDDQRRLVLAYYEGQQGSQIPARRSLAASAGLGLNALRIRVHRIRQSLEQCLRRSRAGEIDPAAGPLRDRGVS